MLPGEGGEWKDLRLGDPVRRRLVGSLLCCVLAWIAWPAWSATESPGKEIPDLGNDHIPRLGAEHKPYNSEPPTSGPHMPGIAPWGAYDKPIPKEFQVHNLEDGGVLIQYNCPKGCPDLIKKLEGVFLKYKKRAETEKKFIHLILAPYPDMKNRIALTAWTRLDAFNDFDEARMDRFIEAYIGIDHHKKK